MKTKTGRVCQYCKYYDRCTKKCIAPGNNVSNGNYTARKKTCPKFEQG